MARVRTRSGQVEAAIEVFERAMAAGFMQCYTPLGAPLPQGSERYDPEPNPTPT